jgi:cytochrome c
MRPTRAATILWVAIFNFVAEAQGQSTGSAGAGAAIFRRNCSTCHSPQPEKTVFGPTLFGIVDRPAAHIPTYSYSPALAQSGLLWTEATLFRFLAAPGAVVPGTRMTFAGLSDPDQRRDLIAFLKTLTP